jgi:hypothetical protein
MQQNEKRIVPCADLLRTACQQSAGVARRPDQFGQPLNDDEGEDCV